MFQSNLVPPVGARHKTNSDAIIWNPRLRSNWQPIKGIRSIATTFRKSPNRLIVRAGFTNSFLGIKCQNLLELRDIEPWPVEFSSNFSSIFKSVSSGRSSKSIHCHFSFLINVWLSQGPPKLFIISCSSTVSNVVQELCDTGPWIPGLWHMSSSNIYEVQIVPIFRR